MIPCNSPSRDEMLALTRKVQNLSAPNARSLSVLQVCLESEASADELLDQIEAEPWDTDKRSDLVTLTHEGFNDGHNESSFDGPDLSEPDEVDHDDDLFDQPSDFGEEFVGFAL